jgi:hypothetical protein
MTRPQVSDPHALAVSRLTPTQRAIYSRSLASPGGLPAPSASAPARPAAPTRKPVAPTRKPPAPARPRASTSAERAQVFATRPDISDELRAALDTPEMSAKQIATALKAIPRTSAMDRAMDRAMGITPMKMGVVHTADGRTLLGALVPKKGA